MFAFGHQPRKANLDTLVDSLVKQHVKQHVTIRLSQLLAKCQHSGLLMITVKHLPQTIVGLRVILAYGFFSPEHHTCADNNLEWIYPPDEFLHLIV